MKSPQGTKIFRTFFSTNEVKSGHKRAKFSTFGVILDLAKNFTQNHISRNRRMIYLDGNGF